MIDFVGVQPVYEGRALPFLPPYMRVFLKDLIEAGNEGIDPRHYRSVKFKSVTNYATRLREWLRDADVPYRLLHSVGPGAPWHLHVCPHCGHQKKYLGKEPRLGNYVLERIPGT